MKAQWERNLPKVTQQWGFEPRAAVLRIHAPEQPFSTRGSFVPLGTFWKCPETFSVVTTGKGCYWHLVGRGQRC